MPNYLFLLKNIMIMESGFFENSLGKETIEVLGFKTIDALEKELELLIQEKEDEETFLVYKD